MRPQHLFSVIIPAFNRRSFIGTAVNSVLGQTFRDLELIVIDDGSTDGTRDLIASYKDKRINYLFQPNRGVASARNRGLELSRGRYIAFLDSDDRWVPEKLEKAAEYVAEFPDIKIFHTEEVWYKKGRLLNQKKKHKKPTGHVYEKALPICCISISTAIIKRDVFDEVGAFDESFEACEDYDFWLRATARHEVKLIPLPLTLKDGGRPDQLSSSVWGLDRFRIKALEKMLVSGPLNTEYRKATTKELERKRGIFAAGAKKRGRIV
jgi:glycosyltransferase involved in cell wall biosynthesis